MIELSKNEIEIVDGGARLVVVAAFWAAWEGGEKIGRTLHDAFCSGDHTPE